MVPTSCPLPSVATKADSPAPGAEAPAQPPFSGHSLSPTFSPLPLQMLANPSPQECHFVCWGEARGPAPCVGGSPLLAWGPALPRALPGLQPALRCAPPPPVGRLLAPGGCIPPALRGPRDRRGGAEGLGAF